jgi:hypothetical protein
MIERMRERLPLIRPLLVPLILYIGAMVLVMFFLDAYSDSPWRYAVVLAPMVPGVWLALGVVKAILKLDGLSQKIILESLAVSFAATLFLVMTLNFLGAAGLESPNPGYIGLFMVLVWLIAKLVISRRYE